MLLSDRIRLIREAYGLTQADVADVLDIAPSSYGQMERKANHSTYETLTKVASAIGVSPVFLIDVNNAEFKQ